MTNPVKSAARPVAAPRRIRINGRNGVGYAASKKAAARIFCGKKSYHSAMSKADREAVGPIASWFVPERGVLRRPGPAPRKHCEKYSKPEHAGGYGVVNEAALAGALEHLKKTEPSTYASIDSAALAKGCFEAVEEFNGHFKLETDSEPKVAFYDARTFFMDIKVRFKLRCSDVKAVLWDWWGYDNGTMVPFYIDFTDCRFD